jgi:hypothetical protein
MPSNLPLATVIVEILRHTPNYVWAILAALIVLGLLQWRDHAVGRNRLVVAPILLGAYSLWGATLAFGLRAEVVVAWLAGMAAALVANRWLRWPRAIGVDGAGRYLLRGSPWPMVAMLAIFGLRYAVAVTLVFHHDWAADALFSGAIALVYGALSGLFAARALRILRSADAPAALAIA